MFDLNMVKTLSPEMYSQMDPKLLEGAMMSIDPGLQAQFGTPGGQGLADILQPQTARGLQANANVSGTAPVAPQTMTPDPAMQQAPGPQTQLTPEQMMLLAKQMPGQNARPMPSPGSPAPARGLGNLPRFGSVNAQPQTQAPRTLGQLIGGR
jgi:Rod binding domain-containing protein